MPETDPIVETARVSRPQVEAFDDADETPSSAAPVREGLPPGFRMRADAHYVDQLDTRMSSIPVRLIDPQSIEVTHQGSDVPTASFVESIRRFGVLQPLLVAAHGSRYRIISGRRRLSASIAAGLREVPCLVQHVDGERAEEMALASNLPAARPRPSAPPASGHDVSQAVTEIANALSALISCADLLTSSSTLSQAVAADLIRAEAGRAMDMLVACKVLRDEMPIARLRMTAASVMEQVTRTAAAEQALRHVTLARDPGNVAEVVVSGDPRLMSEALAALVDVAAALVSASDTPDPRHPARPSGATVTLNAAHDGGTVRFTVTQRAVIVPPAWIARPFDIAWPIRDGARALLRLQVARKIARTHGGDVDVDAIDDGTVLSLTIPSARR